jgi:hypothetical protein
MFLFKAPVEMTPRGERRFFLTKTCETSANCQKSIKNKFWNENELILLLLFKWCTLLHRFVLVIGMMIGVVLNVVKVIVAINMLL